MADGPLRAFAEQMRALRAAAGNPTYRELSRRASYSPSALAAACSGQSLPSLEVTLAYVRACGGDEDEWRVAWQQAADLVRAAAAAPAPTPLTPQPAGAEPGEDQDASVPRRDDEGRSSRARTVFAVGLAPLALILVIAVVALLTARDHGATAGAAANPSVAGSARAAHAPATPAVSADARAAAGYTYDRTAGAGCPQTPDTQVFQDEPRPTTHPWEAAAGANWSATGCSNTLLYTTPTTKQGDDEWINDYGWQFANVPTGDRCTFHIYIADSPYSRYTASYFWTTGGQDKVDSQAFTIDQATSQGAWVDHGPLLFPTGQAMLELTDSRTGGPAAPMTAAAVRLTCT